MIAIPAGIYTLAIGELVIDKSLTLTGAGAEDTIIQAAATVADAGHRVFRIEASDVTISGVTIRHGFSSSGNGGGITNFGGLTITNSVVSGNHAAWNGGGISTVNSKLSLINRVVSGNVSQGGGGIFMRGSTLTLNNSMVSGNETLSGFGSGSGKGGGIYSEGGEVINLVDSTVRGNTAGDSGGGISSSIPVGRRGTPPEVITLINSTVSGNTATNHGGGIDGHTIVLTNSTVSGNNASEGGGIRSSGKLTLINSTIAMNDSSDEGGGVHNEAGEVDLVDTVIAGNTASNGPDCSGKLTSRGNNLVGNAIGCDFNAASGDQVGFQFGIDSKLSSLQDNDGPTFTHALLVGSPAIDTGDSAACPATDQRGVARPQGAACDIGAYEK